MKKQLRSYQKKGAKLILNNDYFAIFGKPGTGKTIITLYSILKGLEKGELEKVLIIAPMRVVKYVWPREIKKWTPSISFTVLHGGKKEEHLSRDTTIYLMTPEGLSWFLDMKKIGKVSNVLKEKSWLVVDESTMFKNHGSVRFSKIKRILSEFQKRIILTGTPASNGYIDLWSQIYILDQGERLGMYITSFRNRFFYPSGYEGYTYKLQKGAKKKINRLISDVSIHFGNDLVDLPKLVDNEIRIDIPNEAIKMIRKVKSEYAHESEIGTVTAVNAAAALIKIKQIGNGGVYDDDGNALHIHSEKEKALIDIISSIGGSPVMVMYEYNHDIVRIKSAIPKAVVFNEGDIDSTIDKWNSNKIEVLLLHPRSAGHGLNLQQGKCADIVWYSIPYDLEIYEQATARVWRSGVKHSVVRHHIIASGTADEAALSAIKKKQKVQKKLLHFLRAK